MFEDRLSQDGREKRAARGPGGDAPGADLGRIISLSDGVFAFALTLLVLGLSVPSISTVGVPSSTVSNELASSLHGDWPRFVAYAFAFVMISVWWMAHHRTFRYIERYDVVLMWLNILVLLEVAVMPFVLQVYAQYTQYQSAVVLFAAVQMVTGLTMTGLWRYASSGHRLITPKMSAPEIRYFTYRGLLPALGFGGSIVVSFFSVAGAEYFWAVPILLLLTRRTPRYGPD